MAFKTQRIRNSQGNYTTKIIYESDRLDSIFSNLQEVRVDVDVELKELNDILPGLEDTERKAEQAYLIASENGTEDEDYLYDAYMEAMGKREAVEEQIEVLERIHDMVHPED